MRPAKLLGGQIIVKKNGVLLALLIAAVLICAAGASGADEFLRERGRNLYEVQDYRGAYALFERLLDENPDDGEALDYSAWCLRYFGDWKSADERFRRALDAPSGALISWLYVGLGETLLGAGDERGARESFQKAIESAPEDLELVLRSLKGMAWAGAFLGDREGYERALSTAREKDAEYASAIEADVEPVLEERVLIAAEVGESEEEEGIVVLDSQERQAKIFEEEILAEELDELIAEILAGERGAAATEGEDEEDTPKIEDEEETPRVEEEPSEEPAEKTPEQTPEKPKVEPAAEKPKPKKSPAEKPSLEKPAEVKSPSSVWGVRIGEPLEQELDRVENELEKIDREGVEGAHGVINYPFVPTENPFPAYVQAEAASTYFNIEGYRGNILKVHGAIKTRALTNTLEWRNRTFDSMVEEFSREHGKPTILTDRGIFFEAAWLLPETRVLWLFVDAGLDGACQVQMSYVDRRIQAGHLIGILK